METIFDKYKLYIRENCKIIDVNHSAIKLADEAFELFKSMFNHEYGSIEEDENLVEIHTGVWYENEELIDEFKETAWWYNYHKITTVGGHYYFNKDIHAIKEWKIVKYSHDTNPPLPKVFIDIDNDEPNR